MASGQQRGEHDATARQGESGGTGYNNLQRLAKMHRGGQTKGEHLGVPGYQGSRGHQGHQTKEQHGTDSNKGMQRGGPGEARKVDQGIDIDESNG